MKKVKIYLAIGCSIGVAGLIWGCFGAQPGISEEELGLRKTTIYDESKTIVAPYEYSKEAAGTSELISRSYENAPPMIPHDVSDMLPITKDNNMCLACHLPENAEMTMAVPLPKTHLMDLRLNKDLKGKLSEARFNCTACHAPQANVTPVVENRFHPDFRTIDGAKKSNLIETLNEGVK